MTDNEFPLQPVDSQAPEPSQHAPEPHSAVNSAFFGPNGLRAGWRMLSAVVIFYAIVTSLTLALRYARIARAGGMATVFSPRTVFISEFTAFVTYLVTSWIMSRIEARRMRDYGLGPSGAFGARFWLGAVVGFAAITALLASLRIAGVFHLGAAALHGEVAWKYAALWGIAFLAVGFQEECLFRGYLLFSLTTGIRFWPAAIVMSALFGAVHLGNSGESIVGALAAAGIGFFFCILLRKTGNLWAAIGFHAAWDWGESFFYGVPDSGLLASGHLFSAKFAGPVWLTGGSVGPEGSWFCVALVVLLCIAARLLPGVKYPNPDAILDPRRGRFGTAPRLFPEAANQF